jgi:RecB family exonuclease
VRAQSFSSLKTFIDCPRLYKAKYLDDQIPYEQSPAARRGDELHRRMEAAVLALPELPDWPDEPTAAANAAKFIDALDMANLKAKNWRMMTELELAVDKSGAKADYRSPDAWLRGRVDLVLAAPDKSKVLVMDWKSGRTPGDPLQLIVSSALLVPYFGVRDYLGLFGYLDGGTMDMYTINLKSEATRLQAFGPAAELEKAWESGPWPTRRGGPGCRWCAVKALCQSEGWQ